MTTPERTEAVRALLAEAESAHGVYETTVLRGIYDQDWPTWYAAYAVEHGIGELVGHDVPTDQLAQLLRNTFDEFKQAQPNPAEPWSDWTARRITESM